MPVWENMLTENEIWQVVLLFIPDDWDIATRDGGRWRSGH